ncbi:MAG: DUF3999 family protein [Deltaproteobacteria bacterium]|nr:MAG: DUF3999 family protein [Deltaproteobacteria bacterium]
MKRFLVIMICLGTATAIKAAFDHSGWSWQRSIPMRTTSGFVRLTITPQILDQSQATLSDLRVLDKANNLVPHVIHWGRVGEQRQFEWLPARLLNENYMPANYTRVTVDFHEMVEKNQIKVDLSEKNYRRRALLEGSNDSVNWAIVAEDLWLFDVSLQGRNFKLDTLKFPRNNFRYLRLTVYNMADDPRRIGIESVRAAFYQTESKMELVEVPVKGLQITRDAKTNQSIIELDLGFRNLPIAIMECEIETPYFYRGYQLLGRNQDTEKVRRKTESGWQMVEQKVPWKTVRKGVLYRTLYNHKTSASLKLDGLKAPYRCLQLRIFNGDNPPLALKRIKLFRQDTSLVFKAESRHTYTLIGGNAEAIPAVYDLAKAVQGVNEFSLPVIHPGPEVLLSAPEKKVLPWSERHAGLILVILIAAVAVMLVFIIKNLKGLPSKKNS